MFEDAGNAPFNRRTFFGQYAHYIAEQEVGNLESKLKLLRKAKRPRADARSEQRRQKPATRRRKQSERKHTKRGGGKRTRNTKSMHEIVESDTDEEAEKNIYYNLEFLNYMLLHVRTLQIPII